MEKEIRMIDVSEPDICEVVVDNVHGKLWVNVNGICRLRVQMRRGKEIVLTDERDAEPGAGYVNQG